MEKVTLKTKDLRLAKVRYYDMAHNGAEITNLEAFAFLREVEDQYINVFDELEDLPVLDRAPYANVMMPSGESYGNKLFHKCGELTNGPCYVIEPVSVKELLRAEEVDSDFLKEFIYASPKFFVDRIHLIEEEKPARRMALFRTYLSDMKKMNAFKRYIAEHENAKEYVK